MLSRACGPMLTSKVATPFTSLLVLSYDLTIRSEGVKSDTSSLSCNLEWTDIQSWAIVYEYHLTDFVGLSLSHYSNVECLEWRTYTLRTERSFSMKLMAAVLVAFINVATNVSGEVSRCTWYWLCALLKAWRWLVWGLSKTPDRDRRFSLF